MDMAEITNLISKYSTKNTNIKNVENCSKFISTAELSKILQQCTQGYLFFWHGNRRKLFSSAIFVFTF